MCVFLSQEDAYQQGFPHNGERLDDDWIVDQNIGQRK